MGGAVSNGQDNDDLVDTLLKSGYIKSKKVEQVFRAIDRADYVLVAHRNNAYKDLAWKQGNIHLSAPCIYSVVMEILSLESGMSFLNLGSGTGYFSTMAGLILQQHGTNHGIELHEDCLRYSYERLEHFKNSSLALYEYDFCEPIFIQGNCLSATPGRRYDRVYCGAACPESHETFIKQFLSINGILVMPFKDRLVRIMRTGEDSWVQKPILPVSFATLIVPDATETNLLQLPDSEPPSLQEICCGRIRCRLRQNVWSEHPEIESKKQCPQKSTVPPTHALNDFAFPILDSSEDQSSDDGSYVIRRRILLNFESRSESAISTTLQLIQAAMQGAQDNDVDLWDSDERSTEKYNSSSVDLDERDEEESDEARPSSAREGNEVQVQTEVRDERMRANGQSEKLGERSPDKRPGEEYSNASDSDSNSEGESPLAQRKKVAKREKVDSGIAEDATGMSDLSSNAGSSSGGVSRRLNGSAGKAKKSVEDNRSVGSDESRRSPGNRVTSSSEESRSGYSDTSRRSSSSAGNGAKTSEEENHGSSSDDSSSNIVKTDDECDRSDKFYFAHYTDSGNFAYYMQEKIQQLPLPMSLKVLVNFNRDL
ncbi:protein-L-isoaspartate O-methyltransferase domain-containing protein 1 [Orussus abietinus]|uniref:protein-L-isoaspartate O-methyltransferase domain-containing protein 1 n=1 Tax=Orussus abietinus TaxID=222816 RepID=UPI0006256615|nr:protein-L-isoaspartate O-methyltransferase domain-containing protein 1 [Orussus abietinus]XP_012282455.1 protein-L-isoaspartate O-methyltransferase domain-containing protein 1 [Orussus abietinus]